MRVATPPALLVAFGRKPAFECCDHAMDSREVLDRTRRQRSIELGQRWFRRQGRCARDRVALELAAQVALESPELLSWQTPVDGIVGRQVRLGLRPQPQRPADPLYVDPDDARPFARERRDRELGQVAHSSVRTVGQRLRDLLAQRIYVDAIGFAVLSAPAAVLQARRLGLGCPEEEALKDELENPPVLGRLRQRGGERLAKVRLA